MKKKEEKRKKVKSLTLLDEVTEEAMDKRKARGRPLLSS